MRRILSRALSLGAAAAVLGCLGAPRSNHVSTPVLVHVTAPDSVHPVRFSLDVSGGRAELQAPGMKGVATNARLLATTPASIILQPGVEAADLRVLGGAGPLDVIATVSGTRVFGRSAHARVVSTRDGLSIRTY